MVCFNMGKNFLFMNKNAQVSMEFIITILFVLAIFIFGLAIFQERLLLNQNFSTSWQAEGISQRFARNINNSNLLDENSIISDYFFWNEENKYVEFGENVVRVHHFRGFSSAPFFADVNVLISDINGLIYFKKENEMVVISYE